jgi:hypothetical protein
VKLLLLPALGESYTPFVSLKFYVLVLYKYTLYRCLGLAISDKKLFCGRRNRRKNWFIPTEFRLLRRTQKSLEIRSEPIPQKRKMLGIPSVEQN